MIAGLRRWWPPSGRAYSGQAAGRSRTRAGGRGPGRMAYRGDGVRRYGASLGYLVGPADRRGSVASEEVARPALPGIAAAIVIELRYRTAPGRWVIAATVLGSGIAQLDATVVGIALPAIGREFGAGVIDPAVGRHRLHPDARRSPLVGGRPGRPPRPPPDVHHGTIWFAVASLAAGLAPTGPALIAARALAGGRGRRSHARQPGHHRGLLRSGRPLTGNRSLVGPGRGGGGGRALRGRMAHQRSVLAAGLLHQSAHGARRCPDLASPCAGVARPIGERAPGRDRGASGHPGSGRAIYGLIEGPALGWGSATTLAALLGGVVLLVAFVLG